MMPFLQPDPVVLGFLFAKKFVYLEVLALLAAIRVFVSDGMARWISLLAMGVALAGVATVFAPAAGLNSGPLYASAARFMTLGAGMTALLATSALFLVSAVMPGVRGRWIDVLHGVKVSVFLGLWWWIS